MAFPGTDNVIESNSEEVLLGAFKRVKNTITIQDPLSFTIINFFNN